MMIIPLQVMTGLILGSILSSLIGATSSLINNKTQSDAAKKAQRTQNEIDANNARIELQNQLNQTNMTDVYKSRVDNLFARCGGTKKLKCGGNKKFQGGGVKQKMEIIREIPDGYSIDTAPMLLPTTGGRSDKGYLHKFGNGELVLQKRPFRFDDNEHYFNKEKAYKRFIERYYKGKLVSPNSRADAIEEYIKLHPDAEIGGRVIDNITGVETYLGNSGYNKNKVYIIEGKNKDNKKKSGGTIKYYDIKSIYDLINRH